MDCTANPFANIYLHEITGSDRDLDLHDHPWDNTTLVLSGGYRECAPLTDYTRRAGDRIKRSGCELHRLVLDPGERAVTLFITGPESRVWGFDTPAGRVPWREYIATRDAVTDGSNCKLNDKVQ